MALLMFCKLTLEYETSGYYTGKLNGVKAWAQAL